MSSTEDSRSALVQAARHDPAAQERLCALLQQAAHHALRSERQASLETIDLAHEVYLRIAADGPRTMEGAAHLRRFIARVTRNVLVDRARSRNADKRGGGQVQVTYIEEDHGRAGLETDVIALNHVLQKLRLLDERAADIVELRVFGGATAAEVGAALGVSRATVQSEWAFALTWLRKALSDGA